jgi:MazG family protein
MSDSPPISDKEARIRAPESPLERVLAIARLLREPGGCPWDREQTVDSMTPYLQEETFEVVEAVSARDREGFTEELGDLLFLVLFLAAVAEETGWGTLPEIADGVLDKLIRRHPHVFGGQGELESSGAVRQWEELKRAEHEDKAGGAIPSTLGRRPAGLPALTTAFRVSEKAGAVGFQWPGVKEALGKLAEELDELRDEVDAGAATERLEDEIGDLLYATVNVARYLRIDPERALRGTVAKFLRRFRYIEEKLAERGRSPSGSDLGEMDALWNEAKREGAP